MLEDRMRIALWGLYWLSNGATMRMDANRVSQSKERPAFPQGEGYPLVDEFAGRWAKARSERARRDCVEDAEKALKSGRRGCGPVNPQKGEFHWRLLVAQEQGAAAAVARKWCVSRQYVYKLRAKYGEEAA